MATTNSYMRSNNGQAPNQNNVSIWRLISLGGIYRHVDAIICFIIKVNKSEKKDDIKRPNDQSLTVTLNYVEIDVSNHTEIIQNKRDVA